MWQKSRTLLNSSYAHCKNTSDPSISQQYINYDSNKISTNEQTLNTNQIKMHILYLLPLCGEELYVYLC